MIEDKASRYHRLKRRAGLLSVVASTLTLAAVLTSGLSHSLRNLAGGQESGAASGPLVVASYVTLLLLITEVVSLPIACYSGYALERRYGLSTRSLTGWLADQLKGLAVAWGLSVLGATIVYALIRAYPELWWLPTGAVFALLIVGLTNLGPVLLLPLFYPVKPLAKEGLRARLLRLAERAGARVLGVYEWGLSSQTRKANAALAGLGATRRILVSDTMLAEYSDDEIEVVLAHELAHHVHGDIWRGLAFESLLVLGGAYLASLVLPWGVRTFELQSAADVAGLPLLVLAAGFLSLIVAPLAHALSRSHERRADRFALQLTRNPAAFISAMRRLAAQNLAEERPSRLVQWLFYSHPPIHERIADAKAFVG